MKTWAIEKKWCFAATSTNRADYWIVDGPEVLYGGYAEADAKLMAAAPEMYYLLVRLSEDMKQKGATDFYRDIEKARELIKKINGEVK